MFRLLIHVEGETEETFVNELLAPHLYNYGYLQVSARIVGNARQRNRRGGIRAWSAVRKDIINHLKEDTACIATTMVDYYGLPQSSDRAWPGRKEAGTLPFEQKATTVENALLIDICSELGDNFKRFIPFVIIHEFEGLLFADCRAFSQAIEMPEIEEQLQAIRNQFASPEEINDSPLTAPSKRVEQIVQRYEKPLFGTLAILEIGLKAIRDECPHFNMWLKNLESRLLTLSPSNNS